MSRNLQYQPLVCVDSLEVQLPQQFELAPWYGRCCLATRFWPGVCWRCLPNSCRTVKHGRSQFKDVVEVARRLVMIGGLLCFKTKLWTMNTVNHKFHTPEPNVPDGPIWRSNGNPPLLDDGFMGKVGFFQVFHFCVGFPESPSCLHWKHPSPWTIPMISLAPRFVVAGRWPMGRSLSSAPWWVYYGVRCTIIVSFLGPPPAVTSD